MTNPEWTTVAMAEPWHRDRLSTAIDAFAGDLDHQSLRIVETYGRSGTLEVSAVVLALRAEIARLRAVAARLEEGASCCGHPLGEHSASGCLSGWQWGPTGAVAVEGCPCEMQGPLKLADVQNRKN